MTEQRILMKLTWYGHSLFRIEAGAVEILIDRFRSDSPSWDEWWIGRCRAGEAGGR
jgi:L-ascorbate metabolism protein UlaG (beta-lactamase superfamily)